MRREEFGVHPRAGHPGVGEDPFRLEYCQA